MNDKPEVKIVRPDAPRDVVSQQGPLPKGSWRVPRCVADNHVWLWVNKTEPKPDTPCLCGKAKYGAPPK